MYQSQNVADGTMALDLPKMSFSASRIYPFRGSEGVSKKWYQDIQLQYTASLDNQVNTYDSLLFTKYTLNNMKSGFTHEIPLSLQFRPFKNFSITPQVSYKGVLYTQKVLEVWDPDKQKIDYDTVRGVFYGQAVNPSISAGYSPQIFGTYQFTNPNSRIQAIRHVIKPSVTFSFVPYFSGLSSKMYRQVQTDTTGHTTTYSIFNGNIFQTPALSSKSGSVSFSLVNLLEAKVYAKNDTTGKPKKVSLIDNFNISTSYNIFADTDRWNPVSMSLRTTLFNNVGLSASGTFSLYGCNSTGGLLKEYYFSETGKLMRLTAFNVGVNFSLDKLLKGDKNSKSTAVAQQNDQTSSNTMGAQAGVKAPGPDQQHQQQQTKADQFDEYGYMKFDSPWSMSVTYSLNYTKPAFIGIFSQTLSVNGKIQLTKNMNINYTSGYDFRVGAITMTQIGITRDLHCWDMSVSWVPNGNMRMWEFTIKVKASVLSDLKYDMRKYYHDTY
jgi:hypothetical protein